MLKITTQRETKALVLWLEGKLTGPWVQELERCWRSALDTRQGDPTRVDLSAVTFIDTDGKTLLARIYRDGAELVASGCLNRSVVEEIIQATNKKEV
ncbi:MAG: STAS domain-containing protein [Gammaproteobacteria bacterium]